MRGKGGPFGNEIGVRVVRCPAAREPRLSTISPRWEGFQVKKRRGQDLVEQVAQPVGPHLGRAAHVLRLTRDSTALLNGRGLATAPKILGRYRLQTPALALDFTETDKRHVPLEDFGDGTW